MKRIRASAGPAVPMHILQGQGLICVGLAGTLQIEDTETHKHSAYARSAREQVLSRGLTCMDMAGTP